MRKMTIVALVIAAATLAACGSPYRGSGQYGYVENGVLYADRSPYNGEFWDRYYYGPRY